jgi:hypothetical protein
MRSFSSPVIGRMIASLVAGPLFLLSFLFARIVADPPPLSSVTAPTFAVLIGLTVAAGPAGFVVSALPISLSALVMTRIGRYEPETRAPFLWAATGGALAIAISVAVSMGLARAERPDVILAIAAAVPGIVCALICRRAAEWPDDEG